MFCFSNGLAYHDGPHPSDIVLAGTRHVDPSRKDEDDPCAEIKLLEAVLDGGRSVPAGTVFGGEKELAEALNGCGKNSGKLGLQDWIQVGEPRDLFVEFFGGSREELCGTDLGHGLVKSSLSEALVEGSAFQKAAVGLDEFQFPLPFDGFQDAGPLG